ncbi:hypothetical protein SKAU_G00227260 [Synaphobranchus kaupii]|uniref:Uncharacterized protein n=1 Tax=Synaphobranchus kaupii TaxID=118154 RepID=A0A9Q1IS07_SYNKA|nr:hypothetical protein SKAU_G00227260 [Synaphobranchus kaupii]
MGRDPSCDPRGVDRCAPRLPPHAAAGSLLYKHSKRWPLAGRQFVSWGACVAVPGGSVSLPGEIMGGLGRRDGLPAHLMSSYGDGQERR